MGGAKRERPHHKYIECNHKENLESIYQFKNHFNYIIYHFNTSMLNTKY